MKTLVKENQVEMKLFKKEKKVDTFLVVIDKLSYELGRRINAFSN